VVYFLGYYTVVKNGEITFGLRYRRYHNITEFRLVGVRASSEFKGDRVRGVELPRDPIYIASRCTEREREREREGGERERGVERACRCINVKETNPFRIKKGWAKKREKGRREEGGNRERQKRLLCNDSVPVFKPFVNKISIIDTVDISKSMTFYYRPLSAAFLFDPR